MPQNRARALRDRFLAEAELCDHIAAATWNDEIASQCRQMSATCRASADEIDLELGATERPK